MKDSSDSINLLPTGELITLQDLYPLGFWDIPDVLGQLGSDLFQGGNAIGVVLEMVAGELFDEALF